MLCSLGACWAAAPKPVLILLLRAGLARVRYESVRWPQEEENGTFRGVFSLRPSLEWQQYCTGLGPTRTPMICLNACDGSCYPAPLRAPAHPPPPNAGWPAPCMAYSVLSGVAHLPTCARAAGPVPDAEHRTVIERNIRPSIPTGWLTVGAVLIADPSSL